ncbi:hypothetical protein BDK89_3600 [Ilumatobacter fluminis]|uniref:Uncharacterized protein n=1 Tax=Ilumatobacter fluminis TaxID=467091 RepID=A0A4R7I5D5_9ACTN|nr:hypothetical protein [Ilumatobacter fluminis]TDT17986.1 hypothetical protein BDK89_3600 [Ilumatobacter fluminis]
MSSDQLIFVIVVLARLGIPLLIFRYPLPAILAALVIDAADQTIFQNYTDLELAGYQGYDKALDVYYLAIAYLSTFRNWADPFAARVAQFLWYYRLVGVVAFELTQVRALLLVFPNTFEYFFICYEVVRLAWNPDRLSHRQVIGLAAFIWIFVKLPQEWWIHIAQLDFTDFMKEDVFGVEVDTSWGTAIGENLWFVALMAVVVVVVVLVVRKTLAAAPAPDWSASVDVDRHRQSTRLDATPATVRLLEWDLVEKAMLAGLITVIFAQVIPNTDPTVRQTIVSVSTVVVANAVVSAWLARRGRTWETTMQQFLAMAAVNAVIMATYWLFFRRNSVDEGAAIFFLLLLTLIITLYDRYRPLRSATYPPIGAARDA